MNAEQLKKRVQVITAVAVCLLVTLLIALIGQWVSIAQLNSKKAALEKENHRLSSISDAVAAEIEFKSSDRYVEQYAREQLGLIKEGEKRYEIQG